MWFDTKKVEENNDVVIYEYGFESHDLTGKLSLSKRDGIVALINKDANYDENRFKWIAARVRHFFPEENYPDKRMFATG